MTALEAGDGQTPWPKCNIVYTYGSLEPCQWNPVACQVPVIRVPPRRVLYHTCYQSRASEVP